jgi:hypothetical protein
MAKQICPACGCQITGGGYKKEGVTYCCKPCAEQTQCQCGCCEPMEEKKSKKK